MKLNIVPARTGVTWFKLGVQTFSRQPLAMAGLFFMYIAAASLLSMIPGAGVVLALAIVPGATLGLMAATMEATKGKFPMPSILISAFRAGRKELRAMLMLGMIYALFCILITALVHLIAPMPEGGGQEVMLSDEFRTSMMITMVLYLPVSIAFWHAPALVHWHGITPMKSLFFSLVAVLRNTSAFLVYGAVWIGFFVFVSLIVTTLATLLGGAGAVGAIMLPTALLLASMFICSIYFTFRDSFVTEPDPTLTATGDAP